MTKSSLYSLNLDLLSTKTSSTTLGFSYLEFLLGTFPFSLPLRASVVSWLVFMMEGLSDVHPSSVH